jgi:hypothetical protein
MSKDRVSYLTVAQQYNLESACIAADRAFHDLGYGLYHVGSSLTRADWRDVDIRALLEDDKFDALFSGSSLRLKFLNVAVSEWLAARSGLPVDFQFQRQSDANAKFNGPRNSIGQTLI